MSRPQSTRRRMSPRSERKRAVGEAGGSLQFRIPSEKMICHDTSPMNDRAGRHQLLSDTSVVWCRDPRSRLILFDILANLFIRDPVFLPHPDRLQAF